MHIEDRDKPIFGTLLVIAALLGWLSFGAPDPIPKPHNAGDKNTSQQSDDPPLWGMLEALFTGAIAVYAVRQFRDGKRSGERQTRAYITASRSSIREVLGAGWIGQVELKNSGNTPAIDVETSIFSTVAAFPLPNGFVFNPQLAPFPPGKSIIATGDTTYLTTATLHSGPRPSLQNGTAVYVYGRITYRDIFKKKRETTFRFFVTDGMGTGTPGPSFAHEGNGMT